MMNEYGYKKRNSKKHTHVPIGKRVVVRLKNGDKFTARVKEMGKKYYYFTDHPREKESNIVQISIVTADYKEKTDVKQSQKNSST